MMFPWGKYEDVELDEIPSSYLTYALENFNNMNAKLILEIKEELKYRLGIDNEETPLKKVYREMAIKYHPDKGGSKEQFQAISDFYERLSKK